MLEIAFALSIRLSPEAKPVIKRVFLPARVSEELAPPVEWKERFRPGEALRARLVAPSSGTGFLHLEPAGSRAPLGRREFLAPDPSSSEHLWIRAVPVAWRGWLTEAEAPPPRKAEVWLPGGSFDVDLTGTPELWGWCSGWAVVEGELHLETRGGKMRPRLVARRLLSSAGPDDPRSTPPVVPPAQESLSFSQHGGIAGYTWTAELYRDGRRRARSGATRRVPGRWVDLDAPPPATIEPWFQAIEEAWRAGCRPGPTPPAWRRLDRGAIADWMDSSWTWRRGDWSAPIPGVETKELPFQDELDRWLRRTKANFEATRQAADAYRSSKVQRSTSTSSR